MYLKNPYNSKYVLYSKLVISGSYENDSYSITNWSPSYIFDNIRYRAVGIRYVLSKKSLYE